MCIFAQIPKLCNNKHGDGAAKLEQRGCDDVRSNTGSNPATSARCQVQFKDTLQALLTAALTMHLTCTHHTWHATPKHVKLHNLIDLCIVMFVDFADVDYLS